MSPHLSGFFAEFPAAFRATDGYRLSPAGSPDTDGRLAVRAPVIFVRFPVTPHVSPERKPLRGPVFEFQVFLSFRLPPVYVSGKRPVPRLDKQNQRKVIQDPQIRYKSQKQQDKPKDRNEPG